MSLLSENITWGLHPRWFTKPFAQTLCIHSNPSSTKGTLGRKAFTRRFRKRGWKQELGLLWSVFLQQHFFGPNKAAPGAGLLPSALIWCLLCCMVIPTQGHCHVWQPLAGIKMETHIHKSQHGTTTFSRKRRSLQLKSLLQKYIKKQANKGAKK